MDISAVCNVLSENDNYLILTHRNPDGDTLCSAAALCSALRRMGKTAALYNNPGITEKFAPYIEKYIAADDYCYDCVISVDVATAQMFSDGFSGDILLSVDHHPTNSKYAKYNFVKGSMSSCGEIIYDIIKKYAGGIVKEEADLLYIAVSTDTGCFQYANTDNHTFETVSKLLKSGAENAALNQVFFRKVSLSRLKLEGMVYSGLHFYNNGKICVARITKDIMSKAGVTENDLDDIASLAGRAEGAAVCITVREMGRNKCKISVRSTPDVSSISICEVFGGGGHAMAAGCSISADVDKAEEMIVSVAQEIMR